MNYSEFSRQLLIDPRAPELAEAARQRVGADAPTQLAEALAFEHRIEQALAVAVPPPWSATTIFNQSPVARP